MAEKSNANIGFEKQYRKLVEEARWDKIASAAHTPWIGAVIDDAMRAIEKENPTLKNVLPKNYASPDLDKRVLGDVVDIFTNNIDMEDARADDDLFGRTYEYCIAQFAEKEGVGGGEFYTPSSIVKIQAHSGKRGAISAYGKEANSDTWKMVKMNMAIRGIDKYLLYN